MKEMEKEYKRMEERKKEYMSDEDMKEISPCSISVAFLHWFTRMFNNVTLLDSHKTGFLHIHKVSNVCVTQSKSQDYIQCQFETTHFQTQCVIYFLSIVLFG
jgi:hypothetical protein